MRYLLLAILLLCNCPALAFSPEFIAAICESGVSATCSGSYGNTTMPGTSWYYTAMAPYEIAVQRFPACAGGTTSSISFAIGSANSTEREVIAVIYSDDNGEPGTLLWSSPQGVGSSWSTEWSGMAYRSLSASVVTGSYVWIGMLMETATLPATQKATTGGDTRFFTNGSLSPPLTWPSSADETKTWGLAVYVTY